MPSFVDRLLLEHPIVGLSLVLLAVGFACIRHHLQQSSLLRPIPGPPPSHWLLGNEWELYNAPAGATWREWISRYGTILKYKNAFWNGSTILVADPAAIKSILAQDGYQFHKPPFNRQTNERLLGQGVIWAEGDAHRQQRRLLSPAFTTPSTKLMSPAFYNVAEELKAAWSGMLTSRPEIVVNAAEWTSSAALDVIGEAGFRHQFHSVSAKSADASLIIDGLTSALGAAPTFWNFLSLNLAKSFPTIFNHAPLPAIKAQRKSKAAIDKVSRELLSGASADGSRDENKSIISMLLAGRKQGDGLSDKEIIDNVSTMITAGHETTGITLSLILYELSRHQDLQSRIRAELLRDGQLPSFDELVAGKIAPLLDAVIQEVIRLYPANIRIIRRADVDVRVPVSKLYKTASGELADYFVIPAGTDVIFPIASINTLPSVWGPDGEQFRAERWIEKAGLPEEVQNLPGGFVHTFTFISGPRACLGMRFAISEIKVLISQLLATFSFHEPVGGAPQITIVSPAQIMARGKDGVPIAVRLLVD